jgi:hypothetical protein
MAGKTGRPGMILRPDATLSPHLRDPKMTTEFRQRNIRLHLVVDRRQAAIERLP